MLYGSKCDGRKMAHEIEVMAWLLAWQLLLRNKCCNYAVQSRIGLAQGKDSISILLQLGLISILLK